MNAYRIIRFTITLAITLGLAAPAGFTALAEAPANDNFANAFTISTTPYDNEQLISESTTEPDEFFSSCGWDSPGETVWYSFTPVANGYAQGYIETDYAAFLAVYTGSSLNDLSEVACWDWLGNYSFPVQAGTTYYIQVGSMWEGANWLRIHLDLTLPPPNDNFSDAQVINLGDTVTMNNAAATTEDGEPQPSCTGYEFYRTVWFSYTPASDGYITLSLSEWPFFKAAYTGSDLNSLTEVGCREFPWEPLAIRVAAGQTYYFQVGSRYSGEYGEFNLLLNETPPPDAGFWWSPGDPNVYEYVEFCDSTYDPAGISESWWDFGDGVTSSGSCVSHLYAADGDYTVFHNITTTDGRSDPDGVTYTLGVRTHDVSITRVTAPLSASAGQTRTITVDVKNFRYPETVHLVLYKSVVGGFQEVGYSDQYVPVRSGNRTTRFTFNYTFSPEDAALGKVTFKAVAELQGARDAFPADNEAVSTPPTKVSRK